jgi:hypothetical protein
MSRVHTDERGSPMDGITGTAGGGEVDAALVEIAKVKAVARHLATSDPSPNGDRFRELAGLVSELAEQVEQMVATVRPPIPGGSGYPEENGTGSNAVIG